MVIRECLQCIDTGNKVMYENCHKPRWLSAEALTCKEGKRKDKARKSAECKQNKSRQINIDSSIHTECPTSKSKSRARARARAKQKEIRHRQQRREVSSAARMGAAVVVGVEREREFAPHARERSVCG